MYLWGLGGRLNACEVGHCPFSIDTPRDPHGSKHPAAETRRMRQGVRIAHSMIAYHTTTVSSDGALTVIFVLWMTGLRYDDDCLVEPMWCEKDHHFSRVQVVYDETSGEVTCGERTILISDWCTGSNHHGGGGMAFLAGGDMVLSVGDMSKVRRGAGGGTCVFASTLFPETQSNPLCWWKRRRSSVGDLRGNLASQSPPSRRERNMSMEACP